MNKKKFLVIASLLLSTSICSAEVVFNWKENGVSKYSDTPKNLTTEGIQSVNTRTHASQPASSSSNNNEEWSRLSLQEQQSQLSIKIAEENKQIAEKNRNREKEMKDENCKTARLNHSTAQAANRLKNKDQLLAKYQADIDKYCN